MSSPINEIIVNLLHLHKTLLETERSRHEKKTGRVLDNNEYFNLVVSHPDFQWLRTLSGAIALLDEEAEQEPGDEEKIRAHLSVLAKILTASENDNSEFAKKYPAALAESRDVADLDKGIKEMINKYLNSGK